MKRQAISYFQPVRLCLVVWAFGGLGVWWFGRLGVFWGLSRTCQTGKTSPTLRGRGDRRI